MRRAAVVAGALALALSAAPAAAQTYETMSDAQLERILNGMGLDYERVEEHMYRFQLEGYRVLVFNNDDDLQLLAEFRLDDGISMDRLNEWNRTKRFSRAYKDDDGSANVEWDIDLNGGVPREHIESSIRTFRVVVREFTRHIGF